MAMIIALRVSKKGRGQGRGEAWSEEASVRPLFILTGEELTIQNGEKEAFFL